MSCVVLSSHPLIISSARPRSAHPLPTGFAACLGRSSLLIGSSSRPLPRIAPLPARTTSETGRHDRRAITGWRADGGGRRTDGGGCLPRMAMGGGRSSTGGWLRAAGVGVAACLPRVDGRSGSIVSRSFLFPSHRLIQSTRLSGSFHLSSSHRTGRNLLFLFARPPPACSSRLACFGLFPRPRPGDVRACVMACGGGRAVCLLAFSSLVSLSRCRSFARCYTPCVARSVRSCLGRREAFYGLF